MPESTPATDDLAGAVARGDLDRVAAILSDESDRLRETAPGGRRLLSLAADFGHTAVAELLLDRGPDPTWPDASGNAVYAARAFRTFGRCSRCMAECTLEAARGSQQG